MDEPVSWRGLDHHYRECAERTEDDLHHDLVVWLYYQLALLHVCTDSKADALARAEHEAGKKTLRNVVERIERREYRHRAPVHHLVAGRASCGFMPGAVPGEWPPGHLWSEKPDEVSCYRCARLLPPKEPTP